MSSPTKVRDVLKAGPTPRTSTGLPWFDELLGGGIVPGTVIMIHGAPGAGKSTLLAQVAHHVPRSIYVSAEESLEQVARRCERLGLREDLVIDNETEIEEIETYASHAGLLIVDSLQKMTTLNGSGPSGSFSQTVESTKALVEFARRTKVPVILVAQETKAGKPMGPRTVEHDVDVSLRMERGKPTKIWAEKNRYGQTGTTVLLQMTDRGFKDTGKRTGTSELGFQRFDPEAFRAEMPPAPPLPSNIIWRKGSRHKPGHIVVKSKRHPGLILTIILILGLGYLLV